MRGRRRGNPIARGRRRGHAVLGAALGLLALAACTPLSPGPRTPRAAPHAEGPAAFDLTGARAQSSVERLVSVGSRAPGSASADRAANWIAQELAGLGVATERWSSDAGEAGPTRAVVGRVRGEAGDPILVLARYDTLPGERDGEGPRNRAAARGPALVLELARDFVRTPRPFPVWLIFLEGDGYGGRTAAGAAGRYPGSQAAASVLAARDLIERVRLAVFIGPLPGPGFVIERDLRSHPVYRESFWQRAGVLGAAEMFPGVPDDFDSPGAGHLALLAAGIRPTVALVGRPPSDPAPPLAKASEAAELEKLARVSLAAIDEILGRLRGIDGFSTSSPGDPSGGSAPDGLAAPLPGTPGAASRGR